jgi:hypothetical protein
MTRRQFICTSVGASIASTYAARSASAVSLHCTPAPSFPVPLLEGTWQSQEFSIGKHAYNVWLYVDRRMPLDELDCDLGPPRPEHQCSTQPLLDLEWKVLDGTTLVKGWPAKPIQASSWSAEATGCFLGGFQGRRNAHFRLELNVKKDPGRLKELHPRIEIVKNPGYWCWL